MTSAPDRQDIVALITEAVDAGARESVACHELSLHPRTYQRWQGVDGKVTEDRRPLAERPSPANRLSEDERDQIVATCNEAEFASLPPSQIVPRLADRGTYIASESSFYRVLRQRGQNHRRGRARAASRSKPPATFEAKGPRQVWSWDITWLPGPVLGLFYYLYLIEDIFSQYFASQNLPFEPTAFDGRSDYGPFIDVGIPAGGAGVKAGASDGAPGRHRPDGGAGRRAVLAAAGQDDLERLALAGPVQQQRRRARARAAAGRLSGRFRPPHRRSFHRSHP